MDYEWYLIFNEGEFLATGLVSREFSKFLEGRGQANVLAFKGINTCVQFEGEFFVLGLNGNNFQSRGDFAVSRNSQGNVFIGYKIP